MKRTISMLLVLCMTMCLFVGCGSNDTDTSENEATETEAEAVELTVFAAASMTETLTEIAELYKAENPDVELVFRFGQIVEQKLQDQGAAKAAALDLEL